MAYDGAYLLKIKQEIDALTGGRIDKISQPTKDSLVVALRSGGKNHKLFISAEAAGAKLHFTKNTLENPKTAPMFCMLLRKHLTGGKLVGTTQHGMDRILGIIFEAQNELGDRVQITLYCEIMGRRSNIILVNQQGKVIDAIKRVDFVTSEVRQILSGITYQLPPSQNKLNPTTTSTQEITAAIIKASDLPLHKAILQVIDGIAPATCREIAYFATKGAATTASELTDDQRDRLAFYVDVVKAALAPDGGTPYLVKDDKGSFVDFCILEPQQYPESYQIQQVESFSAALDEFFVGSDRSESMRQKSADLHKLLVNAQDRITRKIAVQQQELLQSRDREQKRQYGDIISSNLHMLNKGDSELKATNYYDEACPEITIPLDIMLTPSKNAQKYYSEYKKAATAESKLQQFIAEGKHELDYLATVLSQIERAETDAELHALREEVAGQGYARFYASTKKHQQKQPKLQPHRYLSSDGFTILAGKNNTQNDQLTLKDSKNYDMWLHTQVVAGSHVIIITDGERVIPNKTIEEACIIAACHSSVRHSSKVAVDYTYVKFVKKPNGAKPGMVIYDKYETAIVDPDFKLLEQLKAK